MTWDWAFVWSFLPLLAKGTLVTIEATVCGTFIATALGILLAIGGQSGNAALRRTLGIGVQFIRGTPLLVQLYVIFFVMPDVGINLPAFAAGVIGLGLHYACYMSEVFRAGISSVSVGQWDASVAVNLTRRQTWRHVILPQAIPKILPPLGNYVVGMTKEAALLSAISVHELLSRAQAVGNDTYRYTEPLTVAGLIFLLLTVITSTAVQVVERLTNRFPS